MTVVEGLTMKMIKALLSVVVVLLVNGGDLGAEMNARDVPDVNQT